MQKRTEFIWGILAIALCAVSAPLHAQGAGEREQAQGAAGERELIYCADKMTHEEREAYRARMRAARTPEEKVALRLAHQQEMQARVRQGGGGSEQCVPVRQRLRLRLHGGQGQ